MKDDLIRDRFIIGINDEKLREKLLQFENLTLNGLIAISNITVKKEIEFVTVLDEIKTEIDEPMLMEIKTEEESPPTPEIEEGVEKPSNKILKPLFNKKCHKCNETFRSPNYLFQHILLVHSLKFLCKICKAKFHSSQDLMLHVNIYHKTGPTPSTETNTSHIHDPDDYYSSDDSCLSAPDQPIYPFMCEFCARIIRNAEHFAVHKMEHEGIKPYLCTVCGLRFKIPSALRKHEMVHTGEKPHTCRICQKSFARRTALKGHMWRIHKDRTPLKKTKIEKPNPTLKDITMDINFDIDFGSFQDN